MFDNINPAEQHQVLHDYYGEDNCYLCQLELELKDAERERDKRRNSLAQEIGETLRSRGHWTPKKWHGDGAADLILAVAKALDSNQ